jgi:hypothetical protein
LFTQTFWPKRVRYFYTVSFLRLTLPFEQGKNSLPL